MTASTTIHATALVIGERGVLIEGASGAGKSALALALIAAAEARGQFARLVGDDRIYLSAHGGRLVARVHPAIAGQIEARGAGILTFDHLPGTRVDALIRIEETPPRYPGGEDTAALEGVRLPCLVLRRDADLNARAALVLQWLAGLPEKPLVEN